MDKGPLDNGAAEKLPLRALIVEDEENDLHLLLRELRKSGYEPDYVNVDNATDLTQALQHPQSWDMVFSDFSMPHFDGLTALQLVRQHSADLPFIFVSATIGEEIAVKAVRSGAQDYILKDNLKRLSAAVPRELNESELRRKKHQAEERIEFLANYDDLTGLANPFLHHQQLETACAQARQQGHLVGLLLVRLNSLEDINSSLGHKACDRIIQILSQRLSSAAGTEGFTQKVIRAVLDEHGTEGAFRIRRDAQDQQVLTFLLLAQNLHQLEALNAGHTVVKNQQIGIGMLLQQLQRLFPIAGFNDLILMGRQHPVNKVTGRGGVLGNHDLDLAVLL